MTLAEFAAEWRDETDYHQQIAETFMAHVNANVELKAHRDYIETHQYGFGERCFHWLWKLIVDELPHGFHFLEVGVHRGQVLSLVSLLAKRRSPMPPLIVGVSPFDGRDISEPRDYREDVYALFDFFRLRYPHLLVGDSTDPDVIARAKITAPYDVVYIDGCHSEAAVRSDIEHFGAMVKPGGYLVCDDAACRLKLPKGYFVGEESVCCAVDALLPPFGISPQWTHLGNVGHNRVWKRFG